MGFRDQDIGHGRVRRRCRQTRFDHAKILTHSARVNHLHTMPAKINIAERFAQIKEYWKPYIAGELNGQLVKLDKLKGEFVWHHHENEDELILVVKGRFRMELRDRHIWLEEGE